MRTYNAIESDFRRHFGLGSEFSWGDFRPSFDGHLINASYQILPADGILETKNRAWTKFCHMWVWFRNLDSFFDDGDLLQVVVGFPERVISAGARQIFKGSLKVQLLSKLPDDITLEAFSKIGGAVGELVDWNRVVFLQTNLKSNRP